MSIGDALSKNGAETRPLHRDGPPRLPAHARNLRPYVLPLAVAVRPYHQHLRAARLRLEVPHDALVLLLDSREHGRVEERERVARVPAIGR